MTYPGFSLYHATKWGIEGVVEAVAQEVEPFGIRFTLVEPGPTGTNFGAGLSRQTHCLRTMKRPWASCDAPGRPSASE